MANHTDRIVKSNVDTKQAFVEAIGKLSAMIAGAPVNVDKALKVSSYFFHHSIALSDSFKSSTLTTERSDNSCEVMFGPVVRQAFHMRAVFRRKQWKTHLLLKDCVD